MKKKKKGNKIFVPEGCYCYKPLGLLEDDKCTMRVKYCDYRNSKKRNKCDEPYFNKDNELIMEDYGADMSIIYEKFDKDDIIKIKNVIKEQEESKI